MSKKKQQGKQFASKTPKQANGSKKKTIILAAVLIAVTAAAVAAVVIGVNMPEGLGGSQWIPDSARNASTDEAVPVQEVYGTYYSNYQGSLTFKDDNTFELWLSPGDASDGTHSGTYEVKDNTVKATFGDGTKSTFTLKRDGTQIVSVQMDYEDYKVSFKKQEAENQ